VTIPFFVWLIWLPLLAAPPAYLLGRLMPERGISRWAALLALLAAWLPFAQSWRIFLEQGPLAFTLGQVMLRLDGISLLLTAIVLALATLATLFSGYLEAGDGGEEKYYALLLAMSGAMIGLGCAADLFNLWLWFEAMATSSYLLVAFHRERPTALEAGFKYLVQSAAGSVLVLFGIALTLAETGTLNLAEIQTAAAGSGGSPLLLAAGGLFVVGFGVKIALVPLHTWLPDAYSQAPGGASAVLSGVVINAGLVALVRALAGLSGVTESWGILLLGFGALNMLTGNLLALPQKEVKRLLAFSSISHIGFILFGLGIAVYAGEVMGAQGGFFHVLTHGLMKGLAFLAAGALVYALHTAVNDQRPLEISELSGLAWRYPLVAAALTLALLGLGGMPPLAGFMSKFQILLAGMATGQALIIGLVAFAAFNSLLSLTYYIPLVQVIFRREISPEILEGRPLPFTINLPLVLLALAILVIGIWPNLVFGLTNAAGAVVVGN